MVSVITVGACSNIFFLQARVIIDPILIRRRGRVGKGTFKCYVTQLKRLTGRGGRVGRAQVSKSRGPGFNPTDAVSNLGQVRLPHVALV